MKAYKFKGKINSEGNLIITEAIDLVPGDVEVIILQVTRHDEVPLNSVSSFESEDIKKPVQYRTNAFKDLLENVQPSPPDFDPEQARWDALQEKYNL
ncbi:hypothetical protein [Leptolyngbya sp. FACHB-261]|uniref:hypothetical protein n=1 Tax=Leptolyngbya sp. FACHB-261 TaxID=2692806 RepID=UPI001684D6A7|nr:hypothetical protein [Leptolyngbya sp. FACHB-261]MBD2104324.1 hypothetical protein [Leptolyngbya sp. FACHB-261]